MALCKESSIGYLSNKLFKLHTINQVQLQVNVLHIQTNFKYINK